MVLFGHDLQLNQKGGRGEGGGKGGHCLPIVATHPHLLYIDLYLTHIFFIAFREPFIICIFARGRCHYETLYCISARYKKTAVPISTC